MGIKKEEEGERERKKETPILIEKEINLSIQIFKKIMRNYFFLKKNQKQLTTSTINQFFEKKTKFFIKQRTSFHLKKKMKLK